MKLACSLLLALTFLMPRAAVAQDSNDDIVASTQGDIMLVAAAGVGGAVIGLSTLSFYDKPSKHVSNIWTGAAIGIIAGVIVVALSHAQKTQEELSLYSPKVTPEFSTQDREEWHFSHIASLSDVRPSWSTHLWTTNF